MAVKTIVRMGDPRLYRKCRPIEAFDTKDLHDLISDIQDTMQENNGIGLAAPQIGVDLRLVIFGLEDAQQAEEIPRTILINPELTPLGDEMNDDWEGCISIPDMTGLVSRYTHLRYKGYDQYGKVIEREVSGYHARVVQHEVDHLDGILYPSHIKDMHDFGYVEEIVDRLQATAKAAENS